MTSAFVALQSGPKVPAHTIALKLSFLPKNGVVTLRASVSVRRKCESASFVFRVERRGALQELPPLPSEDHLWLWARGFQKQALPAKLLRSSYDARIHHKALEPIEQRMNADGRTITISTSRGDYPVYSRRTVPQPLRWLADPLG